MNPLDKLQDIHLPTAVSAWPLSWPWWLSLGILLCSILITVWLVMTWLKRTHITRLAFKELKSLQQQQVEITVLQQFLKRVALSCFPRNEVAALHGEAWYHWLDQQAKFTDKQDTFIKTQQQWQQGQYSPNTIALAESSHYKLCQRWLKQTRLIAVAHAANSNSLESK